jgi:hypothetical protein
MGKHSYNMTPFVMFFIDRLKTTLELEHMFKSNQNINFDNLKYIKQDNNNYIKEDLPDDINHLNDLYLKIIIYASTEQINLNPDNFNSMMDISQRLFNERSMI